MKPTREDIFKLLCSIPISDTHEHLMNESDRLKNGPKDIGLFFTQYLDAEWELCGMPPATIGKLRDSCFSALEKWLLIKPYYSLIRNNASGQMIRRSLKLLYGFDDFNDENIEEINNKIEKSIQPGYYKKILDMCNIEHCQVNALDVPHYRKPDVENMFGDLCVTTLCSNLNIPVVEELLDRNVTSLNDLTDAIDLAFERYGKEAIAVKNQAAYTRSLCFTRWDESTIKGSSDYCIQQNWNVSANEKKPLEDYLTHYTIDKAQEYHLPYKFHTGMTAGCNSRLFHTIRDHAIDCANLCLEHKAVDFVFMHMTYPYQHEALALAKQYPNAYIDMCWSWMINPIAATSFLKEAILSLPLHKILLFGGDISFIELLPGHLDLARKGIAQALWELLDENWLNATDLQSLVEQLFVGNARKLFFKA